MSFTDIVLAPAFIVFVCSSIWTNYKNFHDKKRKKQNILNAIKIEIEITLNNLDLFISASNEIAAKLEDKSYVVVMIQNEKSGIFFENLVHDIVSFSRELTESLYRYYTSDNEINETISMLTSPRFDALPESRRQSIFIKTLDQFTECSDLGRVALESVKNETQKVGNQKFIEINFSFLIRH